MQLTELLTADRIKVPLAGRTKDEVLRELVELALRDQPPAIEPVLAAVREREALLSTGIGGGIAIPHGKTAELNQLVLAAGVAREPIEYEALDAQPVTLFFLLAGPESAAGALVRALSRISRVLRREAVRDALRSAQTPDEFVQSLAGAEVA